MSFWGSFSYRASMFLQQFRPNRPRGGFVSLRAKIEGYGKNIDLGKGSTVKPYTILDCKSADARIRIGAKCSIGPFTELRTQKGGSIEIGDDTVINSFCSLYGGGGLTIGKDVRFATHVVAVANEHKFDDPSLPFRLQGTTRKGITIEDDVWIGAGVIILDGVTIGKGAVIGAGAVVTEDIEANSVAVGVPAKVIRRRGEKKKE